MRVLVVGARRARQGLGPFVARACHALGAEVTAVVGTRPETVAAARADLAGAGIGCRGYTDLDTALARERPEAAALCTPHRVHREQLRRVAAAGCHCLCEKPLWWEGEGREAAAETRALARAFRQRGRLLMVLTPWPETLPAFYRLHPERRGRPPRRFVMRLSPITTGTRMAVDAVPHVLSLLMALCGPGDVAAARAVFPLGSRRRMELRFAYRHAGGVTDVVTRLATVPRPPRPAGYGLDGAWVEREVVLPAYRQFFRAPRGRVPLPDPLTARVGRFLRGAAAGEETDHEALVAGMVQLRVLVAAAAAAERGGSRDD